MRDKEGDVRGLYLMQTDPLPALRSSENLCSGRHLGRSILARCGVTRRNRRRGFILLSERMSGWWRGESQEIISPEMGARQRILYVYRHAEFQTISR